MADSHGQADIRGLNIQKLLVGFAEREFTLKKHLRMTKTPAREHRWFQMTAGVLDSTDTTALTGTRLFPVAAGALPNVVEATFTRNTSYAKKFFVESPTISEEDIKDSSVDMLAVNLRKLVQAISNQEDAHAYSVLTEALSPSNILNTAAVADGWDDTATGDPIQDLLVAKRKIFAQDYNPEGAVLYINPVEYQNLLSFLISVKGSSIPRFASDKVQSGVALEVLGLRVVVSNNATTDYALVFVPQVSATWAEFMPLTTAVTNDPGIGRKIRVWSEGVCLLTDPKSVHLTTDTVV